MAEHSHGRNEEDTRILKFKTEFTPSFEEVAAGANIVQVGAMGDRVGQGLMSSSGDERRDLIKNF